MRAAVLVLAGSDPLGYSGLQADLRHLAHAGVRAVGIPTAWTLQAVDHVECVQPLQAEWLRRGVQLALEDGPVGAVKIGLLSGAEQIAAVADALAALPAPVVLDPVLAASAGVQFLDDESLAVLRTRLLPRVSLLTPNIPELQRLSCMLVSTQQEAVAAARSLSVPAVLVKGGHSGGAIVEDWLVLADEVQVFSSPRLNGPVPRGTGCMLATLIAAHICRGNTLDHAVREARAAVVQAIAAAHAAGTRRLDP